MPEIRQWSDIKDRFKGALAAVGVEEVLFFEAESSGCWIHPTEPPSP